MSGDVCPDKRWYALLCRCRLGLTGAKPPLSLQGRQGQHYIYLYHAELTAETSTEISVVLFGHLQE